MQIQVILRIKRQDYLEAEHGGFTSLYTPVCIASSEHLQVCRRKRLF